MVMAMVGPGSIISQPAEADYGIAGGTSFANGTIFPFIAGLDSTLSASFYVQNITEDQLDLEITHGAPRGIEIGPSEGQATSLTPGEAMNFSFDISVDRAVAAGDYPIIINLRKADFEPDIEGGSAYLPALSASFVVRVVGASATVNFSAVSSLNGLPAVGDLSLFYLGESGLNTLIFQDTASEFTVNVVPGNYKATFDIPNLQRQDVDFSIAEDEVRDIVLEIPTIEFLYVEASPVRDERGVIQSVNLGMDVFNNLRLLGGPIDFVARISRDGEFVEDFIISTLPNLPEERTLQRATYTREDGFPQGTWTFEFLLRNPDFEVSSGFSYDIDSPGLLQSYFQEIIIGLAALIITGLLLPKRWWAVILRRKKKNQEDETAAVDRPQVRRLGLSLQKMKQVASKLLDLAPNKDPSLKQDVKVKSQPKLEAKVTRHDSKQVVHDEPKSTRENQSAGKARSIFAVPFKKKDSDPYNLVLENLKKIDSYEEQGARSLSFAYELDAVFAKQPDLVVSRATGKPYTDADLRLIRDYKEARDELAEIGRPDLEQRARQEILRERIAGNFSKGGE